MVSWSFFDKDFLVSWTSFCYPWRTAALAPNHFFDFLAIQKIIKKSTPQKIDFFANFGDFWHFFLQFLTILGPFWGPQEGKSENRDFVKIVLPPRREHDFQGSDPPKIDLESRKTPFAAKIDEKALPGTAFWGKNRFLVIFGLPGENQKCPKVDKDTKNFPTG